MHRIQISYLYSSLWVLSNPKLRQKKFWKIFVKFVLVYFCTGGMKSLMSELTKKEIQFQLTVSVGSDHG